MATSWTLLVRLSITVRESVVELVKDKEVLVWVEEHAELRYRIENKKCRHHVAKD